MKATIGLAAFELERPPPVTCERACPKTDVGDGSWLCENTKTLNRDRRTCSSKTGLVAQRASGFNLEIELKNIIPRRVSIFEFLHSQGHSRRVGRTTATSGLTRRTDILRIDGHVSKVPIGDLVTRSDTWTTEPPSLPHPQPRLIGPEWSNTWTTTNGERP